MLILVAGKALVEHGFPLRMSLADVLAAADG